MQRSSGHVGRLVLGALCGLALGVLVGAEAPRSETEGAVVIEVEASTLAAIKEMGPRIVFFTSRARPLARLGDLAPGELGVWGVELMSGARKVVRSASGNPGEGVSLVGDAYFSELFSEGFKKPPLRLFVTHQYDDGREKQIVERGGGIPIVFRTTSGADR